jgi:hypothetical protein
MKTKTGSNKKNRSLLYLLIIVLAQLFFGDKIFAQATTSEILLAPPALASRYSDNGTDAFTTPPFSPSVTSYYDPSSAVKTLICAYTYINTSKIRTIGFSYSVDNGRNWSINVPGSTPPAPVSAISNFPSGCNSLDDPQIMSIGGTKLVLVARAFSGRSSPDYV